MTGPLDLAVAQPFTVSHDVAGNAQRHADAIRAAGARVVVFPEMSLTGYEFDAVPLDPDDHRLAPLVRACADTGSVALAGAPVAAPRSGSSIGMLSVDAEGTTVGYRKMWLGGAETAHFVAGTEPAIIDVDGWRLGLAVCKDTGVAEHAASMAGLGIDVYLAGVLEHDHDRNVQPARAAGITAEHGVWVAYASFAGSTGEGFRASAGRSAIYRPDGTIVAEAGAEPGVLVVARLDPTGRHLSAGSGLPPDRDV